MTVDQLQSQTIYVLRFPLIVCVIFIHSYIGIDGDSMFTLYGNIAYLFSQILSRVSVPIFFAISGYLFYYKCEELTREVYFAKIRKRMKSLLVPYIIWNTITLILYLILEYINIDVGSDRYKNVLDYSFVDVLASYWNNPGGSPRAYQFWFIRDLMVVSLFSPIIIFCLKKLRYIYLCILCVIWFLGFNIKIDGLSVTSLFFFSIGAYFSVYKVQFINQSKSFICSMLPTYLILVVCSLWFREYWCAEYINRASIIVAFVLIPSLTSLLIEYKQFNIKQVLYDSNFFVFASHTLVLPVFFIAAYKLFSPTSDMCRVVLYFGVPIVVIMLLVYAYKCLVKVIPHFMLLATGGRK